MMSHTFNRRSSFVAPTEFKSVKKATVSSAAGEDGDFKQLQLIRQKRVRKRFEFSKETLGPVLESSQEECFAIPQKATVEKKENDGLRNTLFSAVDSKDMHEIFKLLTKIGKRKPLKDLRDEETNQNILHYAISKDKTDVVKFLIEQGDFDLLLSHYDITQAAIKGKCNALHLLIEKQDTYTATLLLKKFDNHELRLKLMKIETPVDIEGQRPRLLSCLHLAAYYGLSDLVLLLLDMGIDVNHPNGKNDTALLWASRWAHDSTVSLLLDRKADPEVKNDKGSTALYWAVRYGHARTVALLLKKGNANPNTTRKLGLVSPIIIASAYGNTDVLAVLLQHPNIDINVRIRGGDMAIHHAAMEGNVEALKMLIKHGASPNEKDELGDTPLLLAAKNNNIEVVAALIRMGVSFEHRNYEGHDVWFYAMESEDNDLLQTLLMVCKGISWWQPLSLAAKAGRCDKMELLLQMNVDPVTVDSDGNTFMHHAAINDQHKVISKFQNVLSINTKNKNGNTPLHLACAKGLDKTIKLLIKCNAKADITNNRGETTLHVAAHAKQIKAKTVKALVNYTIKTHSWESLHAKDNFGNNCLHIAGKVARPEVIWEFRFVRFKDLDKDGLTPLHEAVRPNEPEALEMMLNIFETMKRDARINEQSFSTKETVLHLAATKGHCRSVQRLIDLGADISIKDSMGNTVLHKLIQACECDERNISQYLDVLNTIFANIVKWWCIKDNVTVPEEGGADYIKLRRQAVLFVINDICNKEGLSALEQAFKSGTPEVLSRLLLMPGVTILEGSSEELCQLDITGLTPTTNSMLMGFCGNRRISPFETNDKVNEESHRDEMRLSGLQWFTSQTGKSRAEEIMDIPPIRLIETYYTSIVAWTFALLMLLHIVYMSVFTYVAVDLLTKLREDETEIKASDGETLLLYIFVPIEPLLIVVYFFYSLIRYLMHGEIKKRSKLSQETGVMRVLSVIVSYLFLGICVLYSVLIFLWIGLFTVRYKYQDYVVAAALCIGWLLTISFTRGIKIIHYFYRMLVSMIVRDVLRFLVVYLFVLMAFGFAFHSLFQVSADIVSDYKTPGDTLFLTFNMMIGMGELFDDTFESNLSSVGRNATFVKAFYVVYIVLSTIILLNLLIAMMNDSYAMILHQNQITWRIESVNLGMDIESNFPVTRHLAGITLRQGLLGKDQPELPGDVGRWFLELTDEDLERRMLENERKYSGSKDDVQKRLEELELRAAVLERQLEHRQHESPEEATEKHSSKKKKAKKAETS